MKEASVVNVECLYPTKNELRKSAMMSDASRPTKKVLRVLEGTEITLDVVVILLAWRTSFLGVVRNWLMPILISDGLLLS